MQTANIHSTVRVAESTRIVEGNVMETRSERIVRTNEVTNDSSKEEIQNKLMGLEMKVGFFTQEIERLNSLLRTKNSEIDSLRSNSNSSSEISILKSQIDHLNSTLSSKESTIETLNSRISTFSSNNSVNSSNSAEIADLKTKIMLITQENERLRMLANTKGEDSKSWELKYTTLITKHKSETSTSSTDLESKVILLTSEIERLNFKAKEKNLTIESLERQISESSRKIMELTSTLETTISELKIVKSRNESQGGVKSTSNEIDYAMMRSEAEYYKKLSVSQELEIERWKTEYELLQKTHPNSVEMFQKIKNLEQEICIKTQDINRLQKEVRVTKDEVQMKSIEKSRVQFAASVNSDIRSRIDELERAVDHYKVETGKVKKLLHTRNNEIEYLKTALQATVVLKSENESLKMRISDFYILIQEKEMNILELNKKLEKLESRLADLGYTHGIEIGEFEEKLRESERNFENLQNHLQEAKYQKGLNTNSKEIEYENKIRTLNSELERLKIEIREKETKITSLETTISRGVGGGESDNELRMKIALLSQEIERLRFQLNGKDTEIARLKGETHESTLRTMNVVRVAPGY